MRSRLRKGHECSHDGSPSSASSWPPLASCFRHWSIMHASPSGRRSLSPLRSPGKVLTIFSDLKPLRRGADQESKTLLRCSWPPATHTRTLCRMGDLGGNGQADFHIEPAMLGSFEGNRPVVERNDLAGNRQAETSAWDCLIEASATPTDRTEIR